MDPDPPAALKLLRAARIGPRREPQTIGLGKRKEGWNNAQPDLERRDRTLVGIVTTMSYGETISEVYCHVSVWVLQPVSRGEIDSKKCSYCSEGKPSEKKSDVKTEISKVAQMWSGESKQAEVSETRCARGHYQGCRGRLRDRL